MMDSHCLPVRVGPNNFLLAINFDQFWAFRVLAAGCIAGDHHISVWENLPSARIL